MAAGSSRHRSRKWTVDSGASHHMTGGPEQFVSLGGDSKVRKVVIGDGSSLPVRGSGDVELVVKGMDSVLYAGETLLVPSITRNLLSVTSLMKNGYDVHFRADDMSCEIAYDDDVVAHAQLEQNLWVVNTELGAHSGGPIATSDFAVEAEVAEGLTATTTSSPALLEVPEAEVGSANVTQGVGLDKWHLRFNHLHEGALQDMQKNGTVRGLDIVGGNSVKGECLGCALGKHSRGTFRPVEDTKAGDRLDLVHTDVCGPVEVLNLHGHEKYVLTFIDEWSKRSWIYLLKSRAEVFDSMKHWKHRVENQSGRRLKVLRCDRGGEYISDKMRHWLETEEGVDIQYTLSYTPEQNGTAERFNLTLMNGVRSMLHGAELPKSFW